MIEQYKPGDVRNGYVLTDKGGWEPVAGETTTRLPGPEKAGEPVAAAPRRSRGDGWRRRSPVSSA